MPFSRICDTRGAGFGCLSCCSQLLVEAKWLNQIHSEFENALWLWTLLLVTLDRRVFPTEQHIHEDCTRGHSCHTKVFTWFMLVGNEEWPPAPGSLLNPVQRQHKAVFHYGVTLFCSNCSKQFKRKWFNCRAPELKHLMTDLMLIFNEVVGLHLPLVKRKHLS